VEIFTALTYTMPGMPLIYNGQEYDFNRRLKFFEKDSISHTKGKMFLIYKKLGKLKNISPALNGGVNKASYNRLSTSDDTKILAFEREKDRQKVIFIGNFSKEPVNFNIDKTGKFEDYMIGETLILSEEKQTFQPWEYRILVNAPEILEK